MSTTVSISCPACHRKFQAPPEWAGRRVKCPRCSEPFTIPGAAPEPGPEPAVAVNPDPPPAPDPSAAILGRLDALERNNRALDARLRRTRIGFAVVVSMAFVEATASAFLARRPAEASSPAATSTSSLTPHYPGVVEVQGLVLRDVNGERIATLGPMEDGLSPALKFFAGGRERLRLEVLGQYDGQLKFLDPDGTERVRIGGGEGRGTGLFVQDRNGKLRIGLDLSDGTGGPGLALFDDGLRTRLQMYLMNDGRPQLDLLDGHGYRLYRAVEATPTPNPRP